MNKMQGKKINPQMKHNGEKLLFERIEKLQQNYENLISEAALLRRKNAEAEGIIGQMLVQNLF